MKPLPPAPPHALSAMWAGCRARSNKATERSGPGAALTDFQPAPECAHLLRVKPGNSPQKGAQLALTVGREGSRVQSPGPLAPTTVRARDLGPGPAPRAPRASRARPGCPLRERRAGGLDPPLRLRIPAYCVSIHRRVLGTFLFVLRAARKQVAQGLGTAPEGRSFDGSSRRGRKRDRADDLDRERTGPRPKAARRELL